MGFECSGQNADVFAPLAAVFASREKESVDEKRFFDAEIPRIATYLIYALLSMRMPTAGKTAPSERVLSNSEKNTFELLEELHNGSEGIRTSEIAENMEISRSHVRQCLRSLVKRGFIEQAQDPEDGRAYIYRPTGNIEASDVLSKRESHLLKPALFYTGYYGYEHSRSVVDGDSDVIGIHRLIAVAEYGFDAVADHEVHHLNTIPWDNRSENLVPLNKTDHLETTKNRQKLDRAISNASDADLAEALAQAGYIEAATALRSGEE
jgi:DNA-binding HxlR family transcriptional regulator